MEQKKRFNKGQVRQEQRMDRNERRRQGSEGDRKKARHHE